ncbi:hypothetical protein T440DRAFT_394642 [Plenodomus tracheiphilus IPT5]|uniref:Uncharacterized protein n=1 Tax=Plenodomus tracheiphilus IPT5 TaxID=1408161 RepID=A0A6A7B778_9PLEO|nr:hypothetical protein T440DRAFT_394642 [Plenodomus tracheiphilus IPT5]
MSPKRGDATALARMSDAQVEAIYKTCWNGQIPWPVRMPAVDVTPSQLNIFAKPAATPNKLTVTNYCSYPINYMHWDGSASPVSGTLNAGASINRALTGSVFKASKKADMSNELLVEYSLAGGELWYNLSLITCVKGEDLSGCAGHEGGLQLGNAVSKSFQCAANSWCDDQAYLYQENLCKKQNPVSQCDPSLGLTMEFCAAAKPQ